MRVFGAAGRTTVRAQQHEVGVQQAQAELDRLAALAYGELALTSTPPSSSDPKNPGNRVSGGNFAVRGDLSEALVMAAEPGNTPKVEPGPQPFAVGTAGATITGSLYRYVTWRDESCPLNLCDGAQNTKRVIVAVSVDPIANSVQRAPLWFSTVIGLCFGGGQLKLGLAALALTTVVLWLFRKLEYFLPQDHDGVLTLLTESLKEDDLRAQLAKANYQVLSSELTYVNHKQSQLRMRIRWRKPARDSSPPALINELASSPQIQNLHWEPQ